MKTNVITLIISILTMPIAGFSQQPASAAHSGYSNMPNDARVTGVVMDASVNQPVEYAIVALYKSKDSTIVQGVVSDPTGKFVVNDLPYGKFYALISFIGYKKLKVDNITLNPSQKNHDMGTIKLEPTYTALKEVDVIGNKNPIEYRIDKKVVDVSQNIAASGGTLVDALQNVPSVQTDIEGNVSLRGNSNFTVLIDGKPSVIQGSEALQQIPASIVQNVEIITNPSAKYDAEGSAGIINVIMKKQKIKGINGAVNATAGTGDKYRGDFNMNYRVNKFNFSLGGNYSDMTTRMTQYQNNISPADSSIYHQLTTRNQVANGNGNFNRQGYGFTGGIDYNIDNKNSISVGGTIGNRDFNRPFDSWYHDQFTSATNKNVLDNVYYHNINSSKNTYDYYSATMNYQLKLNNKGHELSASAYYSSGSNNILGQFYQDTTNVNKVSLKNNPYFQNSEQNSNQTELRTNVDYTYPFSEKGKIEAGYQGRYVTHDGEYHLWINNVEDLSQFDKLTYKDNIQAGYFMLSNSMPLFDYQIGLRAENENRDLEQKITGKDYKVNRLDFFPTVHLSRQLPWELQIQASYTRRIDRPSDWSLNPLVIYLNPQSIRTGNPGLLPQFTNSFELNLQKKITDRSFVSMEGFLKQTQNMIQQVVNTDAQTGLITNTFANYDHNQSVGVEFMVNLALTKWFNFNASSDVFNYRIFGNEQYGVANNITTWNLHANPTFQLAKGTSLQFTGTYNAPTITAQGKLSDFYSTAFGLKQNLFKNKASITLNARDIFGPAKRTSTTYGSNLYQYNWMKREAQIYMFTFSYRINNYKQQAKRAQLENSTEDQEQDMGGI